MPDLPPSAKSVVSVSEMASSVSFPAPAFTI
jgi:hypothetical protein